MLKRIACRLIGHPWELHLDRFEGVAYCPRCEESASLFGGRFARHQIDALLSKVHRHANDGSPDHHGKGDTDRP